MFKRIIWTSNPALFLLVGSLLLSGCVGAGNGGTSPDATSDSNSLPLTAKLAFGIFKLEGTPEVITAEQAAKLLPLWKAARLLATSDSPASGEVAAIYKQIQGEMSPEQMKIINGVARNDLGDITKRMGLEGTAIQDNRAGGSPPASGGTNQAPPSGGGGFMMGGPQRPQSSSQANGGSRARMVSAIPPAVFEAVIKLLQSKVN